MCTWLYVNFLVKRIQIEHFLIAAIFLSICARFLFILTVPIFDNDSIINLYSAKAFSTHGVVPQTNTLITLLINLGFRLFGENILVGRFLELLAAMGTIYLSYKMGARFFDKRTGLFASFFVSFLPLHIFYSTISNVYCLLALFILLFFYFFLIGFHERKPFFCLFSAFFLFMAFLCKTFAAIGIFPIVILFFSNIIQKRDKRRPATNMKHAGIPIFVFCFLVTLNIQWKLPDFGISFYRDLPADFLSSIISQYFNPPWFSRLAFNSITPFAFLPLMVLSISNKNEVSGAVNKIFWIFIVANIMVVALNPLNHAPRGLMPAIPLICILSGAAFSRIVDRVNSNPLNTPRLLSLSLLSTTFLVFYFFNSKLRLFHFFKMNSLQTILISSAVIIIFFFIFNIIFNHINKFEQVSSFLRNKLRCLIIAPFLLSYAVFGIVLSANALKHQARIFHPVFDAVSYAHACNILGGEDLNFLFDATSFSTFSDLPVEDVVTAISGNVIPILEKHQIKYIVIRKHKITFDEMVLKGIGQTHGIQRFKHIEALHSSRDISRIFDNGNASLYNYNPMPPARCYKSNALKRYTVPFQVNMGGAKLYFNRILPLGKSLSFSIENNNAAQRHFSVNVTETPAVETGTINFDWNSNPLFTGKVAVEKYSKNVISINPDISAKGRIAVSVNDLAGGKAYYIYR